MKIEYDKQHEIYSTQAEIDLALEPSETMTVGAWRQERVMSLIRPLTQEGQSWLTLGDGNWGSEANWIIQNGGDAHASDYSTPLLEKAARMGRIKEYSRQNAESLTFSDEAFDFVLIKEALHHFPRPWLALYEALRVSKNGVVLFEPNGQEPSTISNILRLIRRRPYTDYYHFEKVGNFHYAPNPRELDKFLLGMHLRRSASIYYNDYWLGAEADAAPVFGGNPRQSKLSKTVQKTIRNRNRLGNLGVVPHSKLGYILFKQFHEADGNALRKLGWTINELPKNPYR